MGATSILGPSLAQDYLPSEPKLYQSNLKYTYSLRIALISKYEIQSLGKYEMDKSIDMPAAFQELWHLSQGASTSNAFSQEIRGYADTSNHCH